MRPVTLDTSCALNFLGADQDADDALSDIVGAAMAGRAHVRVTSHAFDEVERLEDERTRRQRLQRLRAFGCIEIAAHQVDVRDRLAAALHAELFPDAQPGSRTDNHNRRDCLQLASHAVAGREVFCTRDVKLIKRADLAGRHDIRILSPSALLQDLEGERRAGTLAGPPSVSVRDAIGDQDEAAIREVLRPLADDYPDFTGWLTSKLGRAETRIRVGLLKGRIGAVALSVAKDRDQRVVKLSAFYVADFAQDAGLGAHLLWSELRTWVRHGVEKVYVTVSSRHPELIGFLRGFGFLIEGVAAKRYQDDTAEIVLGKHLVRRVVTDDRLDRFAIEEARSVFAAPSSVTADASTWALPPRATHPSFRWEGVGASSKLRAIDDGVPVRHWNLLELERIFHPARFALRERKALIVPIQPVWADAMLEYMHQQQSLLDSQISDKLLLRADNAYYCYPTALAVAQPGTPILFFVSGTTGLVGEARIVEAVIDTPEELFACFGGLGIYGIHEIRRHVRRGGDHDGCALAMRFASYVPLPRPVSFQSMCSSLGQRPITSEEFEALRRTGGLEW